MINIRNNLFHIRKELKISQANLAKKVGISRTYLSKIENGHSNPSTEITYRIANELNKSIEDIFFKNFVNHN
ncbi:MAG: helix-turn-helix transcriptional regulator [Paraclostridium sordellii]|uniref:helix-turn-helix transcriptional regulator n=1 Tax=Paraclostridium sordellii TaxID=1505 RepID=UPI0005DF6208|nr:helix-turn-helix transcriptional regulator [Paeniclostridium sordellii]MRZ79643.1 helix-turn-helix domain-containing protein [Paeniclostridium sordellii]MSB57749.1 helix-turn-helix domain-containing protein [Paeniclostridium sordellii]CEP40929.1 XRE family transcriptional regulator [[Clostridium] sordellii] [Paeniclostridium sordellii]